MIGLSVTLSTFLGWHIYLIIHNMTTIEVGCEFPKLDVS
jgi:hypothetical protein